MKQLGSKPLQTARLELRPFRATDFQQAFDNWMSDPSVTKYLTWTPHAAPAFTRALLAQWEEQSASPEVYHWALVWRETGEVIGDLSVVAADMRSERAELGYCLAQAFWGRGVMTEALTAVLAFLFGEVGFSRVEAKYATANVASGRVLEKCGMKQEGILRRYVRLLSADEWTDVAIRAVLREEWRRTAGGAVRWVNAAWSSK